MRIAIGRLDFDDALADLEHGDVERAAAEVVDGDRFILLLVEPVRERRGRGLVDDAPDVEVGNLPGVLGRLPLRVVEVRRDRDDCVGHVLAEIGLRRLFQLPEDQRGNLRRRVLLAAHVDPRVPVGRPCNLVGHAGRFGRHLVVFAAHEALDREDRVLGVRHGLPLGDLPDEPLAVLGEGHHGRRRPRAFLVHDHGRLTAFHDRYHRVGRP